MCEFRDNDPNNAQAGRTKVSDCGMCNCGDSDQHGKHNYYNGVCLTCGSSE